MANMNLYQILLSNICAVSNIAVQVFEHMHARQFLSIPEATSCFQTHQFTLFGSNSFICLLSCPPKTSTSGIELEKIRIASRACSHMRISLKKQCNCSISMDGVEFRLKMKKLEF